MMAKGRDAEEERARQEAFLASLEGDADRARERARQEGVAYDDGSKEPVGKVTVAQALQAAEEAGRRVREQGGKRERAGEAALGSGASSGAGDSERSTAAAGGAAGGSRDVHAEAAAYRALSGGAVDAEGRRVNPFNGE